MVRLSMWRHICLLLLFMMSGSSLRVFILVIINCDCSCISLLCPSCLECLAVLCLFSIDTQKTLNSSIFRTKWTNKGRTERLTLDHDISSVSTSHEQMQDSMIAVKTPSTSMCCCLASVLLLNWPISILESVSCKLLAKFKQSSNSVLGAFQPVKFAAPYVCTHQKVERCKVVTWSGVASMCLSNRIYSQD